MALNSTIIFMNDIQSVINLYSDMKKDGFPEVKEIALHNNITKLKPSGVFVDNAMNPILDILPDFPKKELVASIMEVQDELLTTWWTRKEAIAKYTKLGGEMIFRDMNTIDDNFVVGKPPAQIQLVSNVDDGYALTIAV